ncbi:MAG: 4-(cytidine 5'-diphospho)-2-C-methyl-D-erythritol kinase [Rhodobacteraceae bacterium]|nr:MAG: 4-(cytidine 5'-diphospho)-2-C-methyl-D-erythritol kinase [Paracoccaceae bacterium]
MAADGFAPAKINLTLHVTGQRADGYHLLDSLVVFADVGDRVSFQEDAQPLRLKITGPGAAGVPVDDSNLVMRAARAAGLSRGLITLDKHLPAAAGIGGGSSDAAAMLRLAGHDPADGGLSLGADVPVCRIARATRMTGIGEGLAVIDGLPALPAVLVNPGVPVPTAAVFRRLVSKSNPAMGALPMRPGLPDLIDWIALQRNDLEAPAVSEQPVIADVLAALALAGARLARMSGSGATCFGLFDDAAGAARAARDLSQAHPGWWVRATTLT